jgi:hypothetical protein
VEADELVVMVERGGAVFGDYVIENSDPDSESILEVTPAVSAQKHRNHNSDGSSEVFSGSGVKCVAVISIKLPVNGHPSGSQCQEKAKLTVTLSSNSTLQSTGSGQTMVAI